MMERIKAIIFDADNTLYKVNKERAYNEMFLALEKETGIKSGKIKREWDSVKDSITKSDSWKDLKNWNRERTIDLVLGKLKVKEEARNKIISRSLGIFWKRIIDDLGFDNSEKKTMDALRKKYVLVVASDEFRPHLEAKLNRVFGKWEKYFKFLISAEDAGEHKPSENYAKAALKKLRMKPEEVIAVGDSWARDLEQPKKLGIRTVLVADENEGKPDFFVNRLAELQKLELIKEDNA